MILHKSNCFWTLARAHLKPLSPGQWGLWVALLLLLPMSAAQAAGTWRPLSSAPPAGVNNCMLLSDGTVLGMNGSGVCVKLTPDIHGSYINGTWTTLAAMHNSRLFFSSELLTNGNLWVAGGEDGSGGSSSEWYDSLNNVWTLIPPPSAGYPGFSDSISEILPSGNPFVAPVSESGGCLIYSVATNGWQTAASANRGSQDEAGWVKLPSDGILTIDAFSQTSEHYVPSLNQWVDDGNLPVPLYDSNLGELGTGNLLPNGKVFFIGSTTNTAIYTPGASVTSAGSWVVGPPTVFGTNFLGQSDAPSAMMVNGKILCCLGPAASYNGPCNFYEYDYLANTFTQVSAPGGGSTFGSSAPFGTSMLDLPDGTVLFMGGQNTTSLYVYTPDGTPLTAGTPVISGLTQNANGSYHLVGTGLNGITEGAEYGDDEQMHGNYPLVRLTNSVTGNVYYARTYNWNSTSLQTGSRALTTEFVLPQNLPAGFYALVVSAVGNASASRAFTYAPPPVPAGLVAASGSNALVGLNWNASAGATAYNVKRASRASGYFATLATIAGTNYTDVGLTNGLVYYYKVAAVGSGGASSDSGAVTATPAGPSLIPGATTVSLAGVYNRAGLYTDGTTFGTGLDGGGTAFSASLLGAAVFWHNLVFTLGPANAADVVVCASQTIPLPAGRFNSLQMLATAVDGGQTEQTFTITYTDNSTATFTQSFSDWANPQGYPGEFSVVTMPYRNVNSGGQQTLNVSVDGYVITLDQTKTVKSITLPNNGNVIILALALANNPVSPSLAAYCNRAGIYTDGTTFTNPATGGLDGGGYAYSGTLLGTSQSWSNAVFSFGPVNTTNVISCAGQTIPLPAGNYSRLAMLATGVQGGQTSQSFVVTYTDATTATFSQSLSDWFTPSSYAGESKAVIMSHRNSSDGTADNRTFYLYGYAFPLNTAKTVQSVRLPGNGNVILTALSLVPNWPPGFRANPFSLANLNAGHVESGTIATNASDLNGDTLTYAKVSGPAWLSVAVNGILSGTPANSDAGTNLFVVSVKDPGGLSNTASLYIYVNGAPTFTVNPFTLPATIAGQPYSGTIATNATDPNPSDVLTFGVAGGPAWLSVAPDGTLSGTPLSANVGDNSFIVTVVDSFGLAGSATMDLTVTAAAPIISTMSSMSGGLQLNWSGGIAPYQVQATPTLVNPVWQIIGTTNGSSLFLTPTNDTMFYQIIGN